MDRNTTYLLLSSLVLTGIATLLTGLGLYIFTHYPDLSAQQNTAKKAEQEINISHVLPEAEVVDGIEIHSGLVAKGDFMLVRSTCTACHSGKLVTQNRASREGWEEMIRWMQETQKLWDLGDSETQILDYLATYYAPEHKGRRENLVVEEWYNIP